MSGQPPPQRAGQQPASPAGWAAPPATGWAAPSAGGGWGGPPARVRAPRPGVLHLEPSGLADLYEAAIRVLRRGWVVLLAMLAVSVALGALANGLVQAGTLRLLLAAAPMLSPLRSGGDDAGGGVLLLVIGGLVYLALLLAAVLALFTAARVTGDAVAGRPVRPASVTSAVLRAWPRMLAAAGWAAVAAVVVTAGSFTAAGLLLAHRTRLAVAVLLLLVALAIGAWLVVGLRLAFTVAVAVLEPQHGWTGSGRTIGLFAALGRSWRLTRGRAWRTFGIVTLTGLTVGFGGGLLSVLTQVLSVQARPASVLSVLDSNARALTVELAAVEGAVQVLAGLATAMLVQIVATLAYADARIRDEGLARSVLDHLGTGVPASPWVSTATEHPPLAPPWGPTAWAPTPPWGAG